MEERIFVSGPSITEKEISYVTDAVKTAWYTHANDYIEKFEYAVADYVGRKYAIAMPSCTAAIQLSIMVLGLKPDDEVILPDTTWISTCSPYHYFGVKPVFADIDEDTWCISAEDVERRITEKTKAIYTVNLYGNVPDYEKLQKLSEKYNIPILEDAAESMGTIVGDRKTGSFGLISVFSFHGSKMMTTGEGGMFLTDDKNVYVRALKLRDQGRCAAEGKMFWHDELADKFKMSSLQAALGLAQIERVEELVAMKNQIFAWYQEEFKDFPGVVLNTPGEHIRCNYWMNTIVWNRDMYHISKEDMIAGLKEHNIDSRPFFYPLSDMTPFAYLRQKGKNRVAHDLSERSINMPSDINITREQVRRAAEEIKKILDSVKKDDNGES
jgi:perosamine synthetase